MNEVDNLLEDLGKQFTLPKTVPGKRTRQPIYEKTAMINCETCGIEKEVETVLLRKGKGWGRFCSQSCARKADWKKRKEAV